MAETVMTIFWNVFQKDCQIDMCDVIVDWPQLPSEYSRLMSPHSLFRATLYFLIHLFSTLHPLIFDMLSLFYFQHCFCISSLLLLFEEYPN